MTKHSRLITAVISLIFILSACAFFTVYAENDNGSDNPGGNSSFDDRQGNDDNSGSGGDRQQDNDYDNSDDYNNDDSYNSGSDRNRYDDDDDSDDYNYNNNNNQNQYNRNSYSDYDEDYDYEGERSSTGEILYVGGDQTYVPPETIPSTTAALYDTSKVKVDENTLTNGDWADIKRKLTAAANAQNDPDTGDFAFIQKNTSVEDNGHWMLYLGFTLICLGLIGFIFLILKAHERKKMLAAAAAPEKRRAERQPASPKTGGKRSPRYRDDAYDDDYSEKSKPKGGTRFSK